MKGDAELMLSRLRWTALQIKLFENEVEQIGLALKHGIITPSGAVAWVHAIGASSWLPPSGDVLDVLPDRTGGRPG
jgi:hypothetical protein